MQRLLAITCLAAVAFPQDIAQRARDRAASLILVPGKGWELLGENYQLTADSAVDRVGNIIFTDAQHDRICKIDLAGKISLWKDGAHGSHGIVFGPDGRFYAGQHDLKRIVALTGDGTESVIAEDAQTHHLTATARNDVYFTQAPAHKVWLLDSAGHKRVVHEGLDWPRNVAPTPDQSRLLVVDPRTNWIWSFQIGRDGSLLDGKQAYRLETFGRGPEADAGGMAFDADGFLYVATKVGVQVFDKQRQLSALIDVPGADGVSNVMFAGPGLQWLYVMEWNKVHRRPVRRRGSAVFPKIARPGR